MGNLKNFANFFGTKQGLKILLNASFTYQEFELFCTFSLSFFFLNFTCILSFDRSELEAMLQKGVKFEIEALSANSISFLSDEYIPQKIKQGMHL
jgi:hypothetical protein